MASHYPLHLRALEARAAARLIHLQPAHHNCRGVEGRGAAVDQALRKLPADLQTTVILADIEGFTYQEMAHILRCPLGTVMSRLHRARRCLEQEMQVFAEGTGGEKAPR